MLDPLTELLGKIESDAAGRGFEPFCIFVGDFVDRGPDSAGVIRRVRELTEAGKGAAVLGNHDEMFLQTLALNRPELVGTVPIPAAEITGEMMLRHWITQGGDATLASYGLEPTPARSWSFPKDDIRFLESLPLYWENEALVVTHALPSRDALNRARRPEGYQLPEVRHELLWRREEPTEPPDPQRLHLSGHTPLRNAVFHESIQAVQLDTACVYGFALSAYAVETGELLSVGCHM